jgi:hypothetical protein
MRAKPLYQFQHLFGITLSELAITGRREMQAIGAAFASLRGNHVGIGNNLRKLRDNRVHGGRRSPLVGMDGFSRQKRYFLDFEVQIADEIAVDLSYFLRPLHVIRVGFSLV